MVISKRINKGSSKNKSQNGCDFCDLAYFFIRANMKTRAHANHKYRKRIVNKPSETVTTEYDTGYTRINIWHATDIRIIQFRPLKFNFWITKIFPKNKIRNSLRGCTPKLRIFLWSQGETEQILLGHWCHWVFPLRRRLDIHLGIGAWELLVPKPKLFKRGIIRK